MAIDREQAAKDRRRKWFQDRARAAEIRGRGSRLAVTRMDESALWETLVAALLDLEADLSGRALPRCTELGQDALAAALELRSRGTQLQLPLSEALGDDPGSAGQKIPADRDTGQSGRRRGQGSPEWKY